MTALGLPYPTIIGIVAGGEWASTVMDRVTADGRYGVRLGQSPDEAEAELRAVHRRRLRGRPVPARAPGDGRDHRARFGSSSVPEDHPLVAGLAAATLEATGRSPRSIGVPYGCDMRLFVDVGATPCVVFGPGDVRLAHAGRRVGAAGRGGGVRPNPGDWVSRELGER